MDATNKRAGDGAVASFALGAYVIYSGDGLDSYSSADTTVVAARLTADEKVAYDILLMLQDGERIVEERRGLAAHAVGVKWGRSPLGQSVIFRYRQGQWLLRSEARGYDGCRGRVVGLCRAPGVPRGEQVFYELDFADGGEGLTCGVEDFDNPLVTLIADQLPRIAF